MSNKLSETKKLEARIAELEKSLVKATMENISNRGYLQLACEDLEVEVEAFKKKQIKKST